MASRTRTMPRIERYTGAPAEDVVQPKPLPIMAVETKKSSALASGDGAAIAEADAFATRFMAMQGKAAAVTCDFATLDTKDPRLDDCKYGAAPTTFSKWGF